MIELPPDLDCLIAGCGPVGLASAIGLRLSGHTVALAGAAPGGAERPLDPRTFALFQPSLRFLGNLGVALPADATAPLRTIRLIDGTGHLVRAPEVVFEARDIALPEFGLNVPQAALVRALMHRLSTLTPPQTIAGSSISTLARSPEHIAACLDSDRVLHGRLVVGADGRQSACRALGGFRTRRWSYPQAAVVASIQHSRTHTFVSTELHRPAGPLTTVPLPGQASSIVWVERPPEAARLGQLDDRAFIVELSGHLHGLLGRIEGIGTRRVFPLEGLVAEPAAQGRVALAGEALHAFPPIGAQGLNLGFRDVASLLDAISDAGRRGARDPGAPDTLDAYSRDRKPDVDASALLVDTLDRSLYSGLLPLQLLRGAGLHLANASPSFRRVLMKRGMSLSERLPRLMREPGTGR